MTKIDLYPAWREILERNLRHLSASGLDVPVVATSAALRSEAQRRSDVGLDAESGFPALETLLREVLAGGRSVVVTAGMAALRDVVNQLRAAVCAERDAIDPERAEELLVELRQARRRAARVSGAAAGWRVALDDAIGDLRSDVEDELHQRTRALRREIDAAVAGSDPAKGWEEFATWVSSRTVEELAACHELLSGGARRVAAEVAERFAADEENVALVADVGTVFPAMEALSLSAQHRDASLGAGLAGFLVLTGAWSSMEALGFLTGLVGVGLLNPIALVAGVLTGRKALRSEHQRQLEVRRQRALDAVHGYLDEATFGVGRELRDGLRRVHHQLRDVFAARAEELERSVTDALAAAERAATHRSEREARRDVLDRTAVELQELDRQLASLGAGT
jgi:hypothetical protein